MLGLESLRYLSIVRSELEKRGDFEYDMMNMHI